MARCSLFFTSIVILALAFCTLPATAQPFLYAGNGNYYEEIIDGTDANYLFTAGKATAQSFMGVDGHLLSVNDGGEWDFVSNLLGDQGENIQMWIALQDATGSEPTGDPNGTFDFQWSYKTGTGATDTEPYYDNLSFNNFRNGWPMVGGGVFSGFQAVFIEELSGLTTGDFGPGDGVINWLWSNQSKNVFSRGGGHYVVEYETGSIVRGDMNNDGNVTTADTSLFMLGLADPAEFANQLGYGPDFRGDIDENGIFDFTDMNAFNGLLPLVSSASAVPEPASASLLVVAMGAMALVGTRRRGC